MAMLRPLGIEKGKPFQPDDRQKKILTEGAFVGEAMAKANTFDMRFPNIRYRPTRSGNTSSSSTACRTWRTTANSMSAAPISTQPCS